MIYHYLMRPCIHDIAGREHIKELLSDNLEQFIDYRKIEDWFQVDKYRLSSMADMDSLLDFKSNNVDVIALYVSPYKRLFSYYLATLEIDDTASMQGFSDFYNKRNELIFEGMVTNLCEVYKETDDLYIKHKLEYDTIIDDLRKIPGLEFVPNDFIFSQRQLLDQYRTFYTEEIKEWVDKTYAKDIAAYGYTF